MVRILLVVEMPDASDQGMVTIRPRPINCFFLSFESAEHVVRMIFDYIIVNGRSFRTALGTGFYVNVRHSSFLPLLCLVTLGARTFHFFELSTAGVRILNGAISGTQGSRSTLLDTFT
jgi:hypothetical protein